MRALDQSVARYRFPARNLRGNPTVARGGLRRACDAGTLRPMGYAISD